LGNTKTQYLTFYPILRRFLGWIKTTEDNRQNMESKNKPYRALVAHPDEAEFLCAGALALVRQRGWRVVMVTMTPGDFSLNPVLRGFSS